MYDMQRIEALKIDENKSDCEGAAIIWKQKNTASYTRNYQRHYYDRQTMLVKRCNMLPLIMLYYIQNFA